MTRPRVLQIITSFGRGGTAHHVFEISRLLLDQFEVSILTGLEEEGEASLLGAAARAGIPVTVIPGLRRTRSILADRRALKDLVEAIRRIAPALVHTHRSKAGLLGRTGARRAGVRRTVHTLYAPVGRPADDRLSRRTSLATERRLAQTTDRLITVSPSLASELVDRRIAAEERIEVIYPIAQPRRLFDLPPPGAVRRRLGIGPDAPLIAFVGRLAPFKDPGLFLRVLATVAGSVPEVRAVVAGDGPGRAALEAEARGRGLGSRLLFAGWMKDLAELYADIDLLIITSRQEGLALAAVEAAAAGKAVVATSVTGVTDVLNHGVTGLLAPPGDASSLAGATILLLRDAGYRARLGAAAREEAERRFAGQDWTGRLAALYNRVLGRDLRRTARAPQAHPSRSRPSPP